MLFFTLVPVCVSVWSMWEWFVLYTTDKPRPQLYPNVELTKSSIKLMLEYMVAMTNLVFSKLHKTSKIFIQTILILSSYIGGYCSHTYCACEYMKIWTVLAEFVIDHSSQTFISSEHTICTEKKINHHLPDILFRAKTSSFQPPASCPGC